MKRALLVVLIAAMMAGCATSKQMHANLSGDARLDFEVNGCLVDKARLTAPKGQEKKGRHPWPSDWPLESAERRHRPD